jgi:transposase InsO family protein
MPTLHGVQFTSWASTNKICAGIDAPRFGTIGDCYDNAMMESFWSSMQIELLEPKEMAHSDWSRQRYI